MEIESDILVTGKTGEYDHYSNVYEEGGLKLDIEADENYLANTASVVSEITSNVFKGNFDLFEINLPAGMLSQYTRLEVIALEYPQLCRFLSTASRITDPLERMKYVVAGYLANLSIPVQILKGCPPIPAAVGDKLEGVDAIGNTILLTHNSKKQDVSSVRVQGKDESFVLTTDWENQVRFRGMSMSNVSGKKMRPIFITFKDESKVKITTAEYELDGATAATKYFRFNGKATVEDETNQIVATVTFLENPKKGMLSGLTGFFGSKPQKPQNPNAELNRISIEIAKSGKVVAKGSGHYSSFFEIDGKVYWRFNDAYPLWNMTAEGLTHKLPAETATLKQLIKDKKWEQAEAMLLEIRKKNETA